MIVEIGELKVEVPMWPHDPYTAAEIEAMRKKPEKVKPRFVSNLEKTCCKVVLPEE